MKKDWSTYKKNFSMIMLFGFTSTMAAEQAPTTVNWHNLSDVSCPNDTNSGILSNVVDTNLDITGTNALVGMISIKALTYDILITVTTDDAVITGSSNLCNGEPATPAVLYLYAAENCNITFQLSHNLDFYGTNDKGTLRDLIITASGPGSFNFLIEHGNTINFNSRTTELGGASFKLAYGSFSAL